MHLGHATLLFLFVTVTAHAAVLRVGPGKPYASPSKAIAAAADGDIIEIDAGTYTGDVCAIRKNRLTLRGVNGRAKLDAAGANADSKGIWVIYGNDTVVENIEFTGAQVRDQNGSGIWLEGNNLTVRNCYFHHNEEGILTGKTGTVLIEYSEFAYNGNGEGFTHNLYIGAAESFTFRYCYSHHAIAGHLVKSRAAVNYILYNRLTEEPGGNGSFELDLPNGGTSYVIGNIIQKSVESENYASVAYFEEGPAGGAPGRQLYVVNNTFSNAARQNKALFVYTRGGLSTPVVIRNNIFTGPEGGALWAPGDITNQANAAVSSNYQGDAARLADPDTFDYRLLPGSPAIDAGADLGDPKLAPTMQYVHPACAAGRKTVGPIDMGAYEFGGEVPAPASANLPERCRAQRAPRHPGALPDKDRVSFSERPAFALELYVPQPLRHGDGATSGAIGKHGGGAQRRSRAVIEPDIAAAGVKRVGAAAAEGGQRGVRHNRVSKLVSSAGDGDGSASGRGEAAPDVVHQAGICHRVAGPVHRARLIESRLHVG
jgi:hypothetical protein